MIDTHRLRLISHAHAMACSTLAGREMDSVDISHAADELDTARARIAELEQHAKLYDLLAPYLGTELLDDYMAGKLPDGSGLTGPVAVIYAMAFARAQQAVTNGEIVMPAEDASIRSIGECLPKLEVKE